MKSPSMARRRNAPAGRCSSSERRTRFHKHLVLGDGNDDHRRRAFPEPCRATAIGRCPTVPMSPRRPRRAWSRTRPRAGFPATRSGDRPCAGPPVLGRDVAHCSCRRPSSRAVPLYTGVPLQDSVHIVLASVSYYPLGTYIACESTHRSRLMDKQTQDLWVVKKKKKKTIF